VEIRQLGGAFTGTDPQADAIGGRDAGFLAFVVGAPVPELFTTAVPAAANAVLDPLSPWTLRGPQINFSPDNNDAQALSSSWPTQTYQRLLCLKARYDPTDVFRFGALPPGSCEPELG
jgi:Berberine and berberine like